MSTVMDAAQAEPSTVTHFAPATPVHKIKRIGGRPLIFEGTELGMAMSYTPSLPYWYELNVYQTTDQRYVTTVRQFFQSEDEQDTVRGWESNSLDHAIKALVEYDAGQDVRPRHTPFGETTPPAELCAAALELRAEISGHRAHYASLVGEFLFDLEQGS